MRILYVGPYASASYCTSFGQVDAIALAGSKKMRLIAEGLARRNHQVTILSSGVVGRDAWAIRPRVVERLDPQCASVEVRYPRTVLKRPFGGLVLCVNALREFRKAARETFPDAVLLYNTYLFEAACGRSARRDFDLPVILQIEDVPLARRRGLWNLKPRLDQLAFRSTVAAARAFVVVSEEIAGLVRAHGPCLVLPGIVDQKLVEAGKMRGPAFSGDRRIAGYFGGLVAWKGTRTILEAAALMPEDWTFLVGGAGPMEHQFREAAGRIPNKLTFLGFLPEGDLYSAMCRCDALIVPGEAIAGGPGAVFPFKVCEYLVARAHLLVPITVRSHSMSLDFATCWDGQSPESLILGLLRAEADFGAKRTEYANLRAWVESEFQVDAVAEKLEKFIQVAREPVPAKG